MSQKPEGPKGALGLWAAPTKLKLYEVVTGVEQSVRWRGRGVPVDSAVQGPSAPPMEELPEEPA